MESIEKIAIIVESKNGLLSMKECIDIFDLFDIDVEIRIMSAYYTANKLAEFVYQSRKNEFSAMIAAGSTALAVCVTAHTTLPVVCVFLNHESQILPEIPVASMGMGKTGAKNAALFVSRMLSVKNDEIRRKLGNYMMKMAEDVATADRSLFLSQLETN